MEREGDFEETSTSSSLFSHKNTHVKSNYTDIKTFELDYKAIMVGGVAQW